MNNTQMDSHMIYSKEQKLNELTHFIQSHPIVYEIYKRHYETDVINSDYFESYSTEDIDLFILNWSRYIE